MTLKKLDPWLISRALIIDINPLIILSLTEPTVPNLHSFDLLDREAQEASAEGATAKGLSTSVGPPAPLLPKKAKMNPRATTAAAQSSAPFTAELHMPEEEMKRILAQR